MARESVNDTRKAVNLKNSITWDGKIVNMSLGDLTNNRKAGVIAMQMSKYLPPWLGIRMADVISSWLASNSELPFVRGIRINQWALNRRSIPFNQLEHSVREVLRNLVRSFYEQFHYSAHPRELTQRIVQSAGVEELISRRTSHRGGAIVCALHMSSFDLVYQALTIMGFQSIGLTLPEATDAIAWQHELRRRVGMEILPATMSNLRQVINRLQDGEIVVTGIDRPIAHPKLLPCFFDRPANLPVHYVQLALTARVPVILMAPLLQEDGRYTLQYSDYITLHTHSNRRVELQQNAEKILHIAEEFILRAPTQWTMFHPVWPDLSTDIS